MSNFQRIGGPNHGVRTFGASGGGGGGPWDPLTEPTLALWIDGNYTAGMNGGSISDGTGVQTYVDPSSNAVTFSQATSAQRPLYKANIIDGRGVFRLNDPTPASQFMANTTQQLLTSGSALTVVAVVKSTAFDGGSGFHERAFFGLKGASAATSMGIWGADSSGTGPGVYTATNSGFSNFKTGTAMTLSVFHKYKMTYNGGTATTLANYTTEYDGAAAGPTDIGAIGWSNDNENILGGWKSSDATGFQWRGDIALLAVFSSADSTLQTNINSWLSTNFPSI